MYVWFDRENVYEYMLNVMISASLSIMESAYDYQYYVLLCKAWSILLTYWQSCLCHLVDSKASLTLPVG